MNEKELHLLLDKYLKGQCSDVEKELLDKLFDSYDYNKIYSLSEMQNKALKKEIFLNIKSDIREKKQQSIPDKTKYRTIAVVVALVLLIGLGISIWS